MDARIIPNSFCQLNQSRKRRTAAEEGVSSKADEIQYLFQAIVKVSKDDWAKFDKEHDWRAGEKLVNLHCKAGLELRHGSVREDNSKGTLTFFNYWKLGSNINNLVKAELSLADSTVWATFDKVVQRDEDKDIVFPLVNWSVDPATAPERRQQYLRMEFDVQPAELAEFQARVEGQLDDFGLKSGWAGGHTYLHLTGREGRVVQMWLIPDDVEEGAARRTVETMPWLTDTRGRNGLLRPHTQPRMALLMVAPFDPIML